MTETKNTNINLKPLNSIISWDSLKIINYKEQIKNHIKEIQKTESSDNQNIVLKKCENYIKELEKILEKRNF